MKILLMIAFWTMLGFLIYHFFGFWGVVIEAIFIVGVNLFTYDSQMKKLKEEKKSKAS